MHPFAALADPSRRRIVELLAPGPRPAGAIAGAFAMTPPAVSQHLKVLREAGLVKVEVDGSRRIYSLDPQGLAAVDAWLTEVRRYWTGRLDALERVLAEEKGDRQ
jgi:DNA-binding transcriptional ArsR family regulator